MPNVYRRRPGLLRLLARRAGARFHWRALWLRGVWKQETCRIWWDDSSPTPWLVVNIPTARLTRRRELPETPPPDRPRFTP